MVVDWKLKEPNARANAAVAFQKQCQKLIPRQHWEVDRNCFVPVADGPSVPVARGS